MTKFYVYHKVYKVSELLKVIEAKTEQEVYNKYAYLDSGYSNSKIIIKKKLQQGLNIENGDYKE